MINKKWLSSFLILTLVLSLGTGCQKKAAIVEAPAESVTTVESTTPVAETPANPYADIIKGYESKIGYVSVSTPAKTEIEQKALVDAMMKLKAEKANSLKIFTFFKANIESLRTPYADEFAAYGLSALRLNSFEDYSQTEKYFSEEANMKQFYAEAEKVAFNYLDLKHEVDKLEDSELKKVMQTATPQGYIFASAEYMVFPVVDYTEFAKYKVLYSPEFAAILDQEAYDNVQILVSDGGLIAGLDHIAARIFEADQDLKDSADNKYQKYLAMDYANRMAMILYGTDNSPMYDYETMKLREEVVLLYKKMASYKDTKTATYIEMQMAILAESDGKYNDATNAKIGELLKKIRTDYKVTPQDETNYQDWMSGNLN